MSKSISIITVTYNTEKFISDYFSSIFKNKVKPDEILMYDAGSTDRTVELIQNQLKLHSGIKLIQGENIGFAAGNNLLAQKAVGEYLFLLNPDTKLDPDCLGELKNVAGKEEAILIPQQLYFNGRKLSLGVGVDVFGYPLKSKEIFYADGAAVFIRKDLFTKLGMFDNDYFMFQEDIDLSWRAHLMNIKLLPVPKALAYHHGGGSIEGGVLKGSRVITNAFRRYYGERNLWLNLLKNYSFWVLIPVFPLNFVINSLEVILFLLTGRFRLAWSYLKVWGYLMSHSLQIFKKRFAVQQKRVVSDWVIIRKMYLGSSKLRLLLTAGLPRFQ